MVSYVGKSYIATIKRQCMVFFSGDKCDSGDGEGGPCHFLRLGLRHE